MVDLLLIYGHLAELRSIQGQFRSWSIMIKLKSLLNLGRSRLTVDARLSCGPAAVILRSTSGHLAVDSWSILGQFAVNSRSIRHQFAVHSWPIHSQYVVKSWLTHG